jgi:hypothetical protein
MRTLLLKAAQSGSGRSFPAWIDAADGGEAGCLSAEPRVRDALVLRLVAGRRAAGSGRFRHARGAV